MANTTSAKKATRKIARRTIINKSRRTQMRGAVRTVEEAIKSGDRTAALKAMAQAEPELMQAAQRNIIHKNSASRKVSRLVHQIAKLAKWTDRKRYSSKSPALLPGFFFFGGVVVHTSCNDCSSLEHFLPTLRPGVPYFYGMLDAERIRSMRDSGMPSMSALLLGSDDVVIARAQFWNSNRHGVTLFKLGAGLPCPDEQKKTRLRSHLSA
jgi:small subunit ribosomal protein S20